LDRFSWPDQQGECVHPPVSSYNEPHGCWCAARGHRKWVEEKVIWVMEEVKVVVVETRVKAYLSRSGGMKSFNLSFLLISSSRR